MENKDSKKKELEEAAELLKNINFSDNNSNQLQELIKQIHILSNHKEEIEREDFLDTPEDLSIPAGFTMTTRVINGYSVPVYVRDGVSSILLYLFDGEQTPGLYIYNSNSKTVSRYDPDNTIIETSKVLKITEVPNSVVIPEEFRPAVLTSGDTVITFAVWYARNDTQYQVEHWRIDGSGKLKDSITLVASRLAPIPHSTIATSTLASLNARYAAAVNSSNSVGLSMAASAMGLSLSKSERKLSSSITSPPILIDSRISYR